MREPTWLFVYGQLMRPGPYDATVNGEMRMRVETDPACRFGRHFQGLVYGQLRQFTAREVESLTWTEAPQYALRQIGSHQGHFVFAFEDVQPNFENEPLVPTGMWKPRLHATETQELVVKAKSKRPLGPGHKEPGNVKVVVTEARLNKMRDTMAQPIKVGLLSGIKAVRRNLSADDMRKAFMRKDYRPVMEKLGPALEGPVGDGVRDAIRGVHGEMVAMLPANRREELRFDPTNPNIARYVERRTGALITTSEDGMREAVRAMTTGALAKGMNPRQSAALIRDSIGLNEPQSRALANYTANLVEQGVPDAQVSKLSTEYSERMLDYRAQMIARTEVRNAQNTGQLEIWKQGVKDELLPKGSRKVWQVDGAPCEEWCGPMDGISVPLDAPFLVSNTRTGEIVEVDVPSEIHPHCMCVMQIEMAEEEEPEQPQEPDDDAAGEDTGGEA